MDHGGEIGTFVIRIIDATGTRTARIPLSSRSKYYEPGSNHTVVLPGDVVGKPEAVEISWEYQTSVFNPLTWRLLHTPRVYVDSLIVDSLEASRRFVRQPRIILSLRTLNGVNYKDNIRINKSIILHIDLSILFFNYS